MAACTVAAVLRVLDKAAEWRLWLSTTDNRESPCAVCGDASMQPTNVRPNEKETP